MKTLFICALALSSMGTTVTIGTATAYAEVEPFWTEGLFENGAHQAPPEDSLLKKLANLTSDRDDKKAELFAFAKQNQVGGMYSLTNGDGTVFTLAEIESPAGAVMAVVRGRNALILQGKLDRASQEGRFVIKYLSSGIFNKYESCEFNLRRSGDNWFVQNAYTGARVTNVHVITHSTGITTLQGLCPEEK